jgi:large subunit ribosomal protein L7/L12
MAELDKIVDQLSKLSVMEAADLAKKLEETWGVTASAVATVAATPQGGDADSGTEEKSEYNVVLEAIGEKKISVIKEVKSITGLGLKEAKNLVESAPKSLKEAVPKAEAEDIKAKLEAAGAKVSLK